MEMLKLQKHVTGKYGAMAWVDQGITASKADLNQKIAAHSPGHVVEYGESVVSVYRYGDEVWRWIPANWN